MQMQMGRKLSPDDSNSQGWHEYFPFRGFRDSFIPSKETGEYWFGKDLFLLRLSIRTTLPYVKKHLSHKYLSQIP
jgi:hypothetical protein